MPDNPNSADSQSPSKALPDLDQLTTWILQALPYVRPQFPNDHTYRGHVMAALQLIETARDEGARWLDKMSKPAQQKAAEHQWSLEHSPYKTLMDPRDPKDRSTARGYLLDKHQFDPYHSEATLRAALTEYGIPIKSDTKVIKDIITGEQINLGDTVLESDLDRFVQELRAKEAVRKQVKRRRAKDP
jgi:hypothetical protein